MALYVHGGCSVAHDVHMLTLERSTLKTESLSRKHCSRYQHSHWPLELVIDIEFLLSHIVGGRYTNRQYY